MDSSSTTVAAPKRMGKLRASYLLAVESFELFRKDAEIVWFVIAEAVIILALLAAAAGGFFWFAVTETAVLPFASDSSLPYEVLGYVALFLCYMVGAYITTYFGVALTSVVAARIEGEDKNLGDGIRAANHRAGKIFAWSLLSSTVGVILQLIADKGSWVGRIFSWFGGVAWSVATFFIVPVLAREEEGVIGSVKRSGQTFVSTWGETIILNFSLGLFFSVIHVVLIVLFIVSLFGAMSIGTPAGIALAIAVGALFLALFVAAMVIHSVLEKVFRVVLYEYATRGTIPDSFTPELIMGALTRKGAAPTV